MLASTLILLASKRPIACFEEADCLHQCRALQSLDCCLASTLPRWALGCWVASTPAATLASILGCLVVSMLASMHARFDAAFTCFEDTSPLPLRRFDNWMFGHLDARTPFLALILLLLAPVCLLASMLGRLTLAQTLLLALMVLAQMLARFDRCTRHSVGRFDNWAFRAFLCASMMVLARQLAWIFGRFGCWDGSSANSPIAWISWLPSMLLIAPVCPCFEKFGCVIAPLLLASILLLAKLVFWIIGSFVAFISGCLVA
jgi:hypothetical protein